MPAKKTKVSSVQTLKEIIQILRKNRADLDRLKVKHLMVFGSFARNEQTSASDVDLLVEFSVPVGYFHFYDLRVFLERVLKRKVDLTTLDALKPAYRNEILKDSIRAS